MVWRSIWSFSLSCVVLSVSLIDASWQTEETVVPTDATDDDLISLAASVVPTERQLAHLNRRFIGFVHFGPNTFTGREWGTGLEDPAVFHPTALDTDQWCRTMVAAGMTHVIFTAKHHDGFCLWQTRYEPYQSVRGTAWRDGKGDVLRSLADSCQKFGLSLGVYLSPADLYQLESEGGCYGNQSPQRPHTIPLPSDRPFRDTRTFQRSCDDYNAYFMSQLFELLTEYGPIAEVWFDGANPKPGSGQQYDRGAWFQLVRELAPEAVIFGGPDVRWCGNEAGRTRESEWNVLPMRQPVWVDRTDTDLGSRNAILRPRPTALRYMIAETNTSLRAGWFWRNETEQAVRSPEDVVDMYERAVGGNSVFLLNVPPDARGKFAPRDVACLETVGRLLQETYGSNLAEGATCRAAEVLDEDALSFWQPAGETGHFVLEWAQPQRINRVVLDEATPIHGQRIERYAIDVLRENAWHPVAEGTTVGHRRIARFASIETNQVRVRILQSRARPSIARCAVHYCPPQPLPLTAFRNAEGAVVIAPKRPKDFPWKPHRQGGLAAEVEPIHWTVGVQTPSLTSPRYVAPLDLPWGGPLRARSFAAGRTGPELSTWIGVAPQRLALFQPPGEPTRPRGALSNPGHAIDGNRGSVAFFEGGPSPALSVDLGAVVQFRGVRLVPAENAAEDSSRAFVGRVEFRQGPADTEWRPAGTEVRGENLQNDPSPRTILFAESVQGRYLRWFLDPPSRLALAEFEILVDPAPPTSERNPDR